MQDCTYGCPLWAPARGTHKGRPQGASARGAHKGHPQGAPARGIRKGYPQGAPTRGIRKGYPQEASARGAHKGRPYIPQIYRGEPLASRLGQRCGEGSLGVDLDHRTAIHLRGVEVAEDVHMLAR